MSEHTKGWLEGWYFSGDHRHPKVAGQVVCCGRNWLVDIKPSVVNPVRAEGIAIARLLVKAPEMLQKLRDAAGELDELQRLARHPLNLPSDRNSLAEEIDELIAEIEGGDDD